jgi:hypothetical protein
MIMADTKRSIADATRMASVLFASLTTRGVIQEIKVDAPGGKQRCGIAPGPATLVMNSTTQSGDDP